MKRWQCKNRIADTCNSIPSDPSVCLRFRCPNLRHIEQGLDQTVNVPQCRCLQVPEGDRCYPKWDNIRSFLAREDEAVKPNAGPNFYQRIFRWGKALLSLSSCEEARKEPACAVATSNKPSRTQISGARGEGLEVAWFC